MANDLTKIPWIIDTAAATVLSTDRLRVGIIRWEGATTLAHAAVVQDAAGREVWSDQADAANYESETYPERDIEGLKVPTLGSGRLKIWLR
jgi:hypothetical protein